MLFGHILLMYLSGEALGAIGCRSVIDLLAEYSKDPVPEVPTFQQVYVMV